MDTPEVRVELFPQPWVKWIYMPNLASVVTSVSIVETTNEEERKRSVFWIVSLYLCFLPRHEDEYLKGRGKQAPQDKTPKFEFYLYNDAGRIIKQHLSIHEIQQILLQQSQELGDTDLGYL